MKQLYFLLLAVLCFCLVVQDIKAQECAGFGATYTAYESRCAATGSIKVSAFGGSGTYKYKVLGTVSTNYTSADSITGLPAGTYTLFVTDLVTNCAVSYRGIVVPGTYQDPRFTLNVTHVTCDNGNNGSITLNAQSFGRAPFTYSIIAPSPMAIGTSNSTGTFHGLVAGLYTVRLQDSCGGIQTRLVNINNYTWRLDAYPFSKISCDRASGYIRVTDNRGNISTSGGIPGFTYGIIRAADDTIWSGSPNFNFSLGGRNSFEVVAKDACGKMKKALVTVGFRPSVGTNVNQYAQTCNSFAASLTNISNFFGALFCIADSSGAVLDCNTTGSFTGLPYGRYCINAYDSCADTTIIRCFTALPPSLRVDQFVQITNRACNNFSAAITGQVGLTTPQYCLNDSAGNVIACNNTGVFGDLTYGDYCIVIRDGCRDTTITRCFNARKPGPVLPDSLTPYYRNCYNFGLNVTGTNLFNPRFCIYDSSGALLYCNSNGVFDSLLYGNYCISLYDSCYDTTITRCIGIYGPEVVNTITGVVSSRACKTFSINVYGTNIINPMYCLYNAADSLIACSSTGAFNDVPYGSYTVRTRISCPDTTLIYRFQESPPLPSLSTSLNIGGKTCATFSVSTQGEQNITNPQYCLYDSQDSLISCNNTGAFTNLAYGSYCMRIADGCYDTTITRCFTAAPNPVALSVTTRKSCVNGFAKMSISFTGAVLPATVNIFLPSGDSFAALVATGTIISLDSLPGTTGSQRYKVVVYDACGKADSGVVSATANIFTHSAAVIQRCPSSTWSNGSGSITATGSSNSGSVWFRIIKKDNINYSNPLSPSNVTGGVATFNNLGPGRYVIRYRINDGCNVYYYDTVNIRPYVFPNLNRSTAYQCDQNGFSIGAVVSNGVGPYTYEIIGSTPASPSLVTAPQASSVFNINNGTTYSLVRLRALDACGNATLQDASILPLASNFIDVDFNCFQLYSNLSIDTVSNATYSWYLKHTEQDADSIFLGTGSSYFIPYLTPADTGLYVCHVVVNGGCIRRSYYRRLTGACSNYLSLTLEDFKANYTGDDVVLQWKLFGTEAIRHIIVERKVDNNRFTPLSTIMPVNTSAYNYKDVGILQGQPTYRLRLETQSMGIKYSKEISPRRQSPGTELEVYPNPVGDRFNIISPTTSAVGAYRIQLLNLQSQVVKDMLLKEFSGKVSIPRTRDIAAGTYVLRFTNLSNGQTCTRKLIFLPLP